MTLAAMCTDNLSLTFAPPPITVTKVTSRMTLADGFSHTQSMTLRAPLASSFSGSLFDLYASGVPFSQIYAHVSQHTCQITDL
jgi:hypothetical protein